MRTGYVVIDKKTEAIESFHLSKVNRNILAKHVLKCDLGSFMALESYAASNTNFSYLPFTIVDGVFYLNEVLERMKGAKKKQEEDELMYEIINDASSSYSQEDTLFSKFQKLTPEKREECLFRLGIKAYYRASRVRSCGCGEDQ